MTEKPSTPSEIKEFLRDWRVARNHPVDPKVAKQEVALKYDCSTRTCRRWWLSWRDNPPEVHDPPRPPMTRPPRPVHVPQTFAIDGEITEASVESFLLTCMAENPGDPRVANLLISWLDKKAAITPTNNEEVNEDNNWARELREIQDAVFR